VHYAEDTQRKKGPGKVIWGETGRKRGRFRAPLLLLPPGRKKKRNSRDSAEFTARRGAKEYEERKGRERYESL